MRANAVTKTKQLYCKSLQSLGISMHKGVAFSAASHFEIAEKELGTLWAHRAPNAEPDKRPGSESRWFLQG